jgi:phage baseplate assembly protein W
MINITNLTSKSSGRNYIFSDLDLNFQQKQISGNRKSNDVASGIDVVVSLDAEAVKNSIRNLLFQKRYLTNFNINLKNYIGQNISTLRGKLLGEQIEKGIALYEPRAKVEKIFVATNEDENSYYISMVLRLVNFENTVVLLNSTLDRNGTFTFINN